MITTVFSVLRINLYWMTWNLYLAFIPLALSLVLFRSQRPHSWFWYLQLLVFIAFLPNAPYLVTDLIHLNDFIHITNSVWIILLIVLPLYLLFIFAGFEAYVLSLINMGDYLQRMGWGRWIFRAELFVNSLCAIGVYLGRFLRFNSWNFITKTNSLANSIIEVLLSFRQLLIIAVIFVVLSGLYWLMKQVSMKIIRQNSIIAATNK